MDRRRNGDTERRSDGTQMNLANPKPSETPEEFNHSDNEDVISLYAHSDYEFEGDEDFSESKQKRHSSHATEYGMQLKNAADKSSKFQGMKTRGFQNFNRDGAPSKSFLSARSSGRRFSRGRKKWPNRKNDPDGFGHNSTRNPPGENSRGNKGLMRRPYFSKYSNSNFSSDSHARTRGILGDTPARRLSVPQYSSKSCNMDTDLRSFDPQGLMDNAAGRNKRQAFNDQRRWYQTNVSTSDRLEWSNDSHYKNDNRNRRNYRGNVYQRRAQSRRKDYGSMDAMHVNPSNNETSEEGNESPKLENLSENTMSCLLPRDMDSCDARHVILESERHSSHTASSDPSYLQSKLSFYHAPDNEPQRHGSTNRSSLLPTPAGTSVSEYGPPAKKRAALLPTPTAADTSVATDLVKISHEISGSSPTDNAGKVLSPVRRSVEKTATVAPLQKVSRLSDLADDAESRQLVTPPIEVSYIVDAPPRPPNPGPTFVISSNSNSPAASRPSSRSGRFTGYEPTRSATPDVPPRPVNPPPPVCAPSPASTPEGMPPRPQNPGPPLDVSLSTMTARSVPSSNATTTFHVVPVSCSSTGGLLPLPAHSKLPTRQHASPGEEPSPAHGAVSRLGMLQSAANTLCANSTVSSPLAGDLPMKRLLPGKDSGAKQADSGSDEDKQEVLSMSEFESALPLTGRNGSAQTAVIDLSKSTSVHLDASPVHDEASTPKDVKGILPSPESLISKSQPHMTSSCASLSFSTTVVSSSYPISSCLSSAYAKTSQSSKSSLLPAPDDKAAEDSKLTKTFPTSESSLKERIIACLREKRFSDGLSALKDAMRKMPEKFGDGEVYEVIEFFGQNDAYEHVVSAARLVRNPDERLLNFLENIAEQVPDVLKDKRDDIWLIYNDALSKNANVDAIDSCIRCFAVLECWTKVWTTLQLFPTSVSLPPPTISLCLQSLARGEADKHLQAGVSFLASLSVITKRALDIDVVHALWLRCAELGLAEAVSAVDLVLKLMPQAPEVCARHNSRIQAFLMERLVAGDMAALSNFVLCVGSQPCQQHLDFFVAGFMLSEQPVDKALSFMKQLRGQRPPARPPHDAFAASLCVRLMRHLSHRQAWAEAGDLWRQVGELGIACERLAALESESQTSIALLALEVNVRLSRFDAAVSMLSESLVLGQPWTDSQLVRKRICLLREIFESSIDNCIDFAATAFKALLSTKDTDQAILHDYGRIVDLMTVYNDYLVAACHHGSLQPLTTALDLAAIAHQKQLLVKPTVLRYLVVACVRFKLHTKAKEFLQRGMTVSIYPTIDVHSNLLLLPTDLATEEIAALLLLYLLLLKEYLVQALVASRVGDEANNGGGGSSSGSGSGGGGGGSSGAVDVLEACGLTVVPNNVTLRDREFAERFQLVCSEFGLLQRVQAILEGRPLDYLKCPISAELSCEGGRSVLKLNTSEVYNNVYYIDPPGE